MGLPPRGERHPDGDLVDHARQQLGLTLADLFPGMTDATSRDYVLACCAVTDVLASLVAAAVFTVGYATAGTVRSAVLDRLERGTQAAVQDATRRAGK